VPDPRRGRRGIAGPDPPGAAGDLRRRRIHPELEESSLAAGADGFTTFRRVTLPLLEPGLAAGWALLFAAFTRELSASILLYSPKLEVVSVVIYDMYGEGNFRLLSALTMLQRSSSR